MIDQVIIDLQTLVQQLDDMRTDTINEVMAAPDPAQGLYLLGQVAAYEHTRMMILSILTRSMGESTATDFDI